MEDISVGGGGIVWMEDEKPKPSNSNIDFNLNFNFSFNGDKGSKMVKTPRKKVRKIKQKEFIGWGSKQLMEFLESINSISGDDQVVMSQSDVTDVIHKYINDNHLIHPGKGKKKRVLCDLKLHALFGRKSISRIKIYDLLETHFADNLILDDSDTNNNDDHDDGDDINNDNDEDISANIDDTNDDDDDDETKKTNSNKKKKKKKSNISTCTGITTSSFAALIPENIKLVYLRKCVVLDIISNGNLDMLVGGFIRIKSDPNNYLQINSHMLLQLTGVKKPFANDDDDHKNTPTSILLEVANSVKDVHIDMLSDDYFSQEELEDLRKRVKDGSLKRPTVVEFEEKARILHQDITKHWIARELSLLQNLIDRANEKGWRRELFDYLERRQLLQTPSEQSRLLMEVPKVFAEDIIPEVTVQNYEDNNVDDEPSPKSTNLMEVLETPASNFPKVFPKEIVPDVAVQNSENNVDDNPSPRSTNRMEVPEVTVQNSEISDRTATAAAVEEKQVVNNEKEGMAEQVIDLSDDDDEVVKRMPRIEDDLGTGELWHYTDPQGEVQGPFSLTSLKGWSDAEYFPPDFKVWKTTHHVDDALLLSDLLLYMFPPSSS